MNYLAFQFPFNFGDSCIYREVSSNVGSFCASDSAKYYYRTYKKGALIIH